MNTKKQIREYIKPILLTVTAIVAFAAIVETVLVIPGATQNVGVLLQGILVKAAAMFVLFTIMFTIIVALALRFYGNKNDVDT